MSAAPRVVISGYYGYGNAGDEAVLAGLVDVFRAAVPGLGIAVASGDPEATRRLHAVDAFHRYRWREFQEALRRCDALVSGGGSLFQDVTSRRSIYYYLGVLALARWCRRPVMICGQGIGPIRSPLARRLTRALLNRTQLVTVRDPDSVQTLDALGVRQPPVHLTADPVFALTPAPAERGKALLEEAGVDLSRPRVAFALREWAPPGSAVPPNPDRLDVWSEAVAFVCRGLGAQAVLVPLHLPEDAHVAERVAARAGVPAVTLPGGLPPRETMAVFGHMDLVVALRLHALIFAVAQGVPVVGVSYDPKIDGFLRRLHRTPAGSAASITGEALSDAIRQAWNARGEERRWVQEQAAHLKASALTNGTLLASLLRAPAVS